MNLYKISHYPETFSNIPTTHFNTMCEGGLVLQTLSHLSIVAPDLDKQFSVVILFNNGVDIKQWDITDWTNNKKIFIVFDEKGRIPTELLQPAGNIVFHAYLNFPEHKKPHPNLFHYPLGCNSFVEEMSYRPVGERKLNVFFSGNLHAGRKKLYQSLSSLPFLPLPILSRLQNRLKIKFDNKFPSSYIRFTDGFSRGFTTLEYANYLANSKIIISPPGISNLECFRHYEGLRAGCVVVTERLPVKPQFEGSPVIEVGNWSNGFKIISTLINNHTRLEELSKQSYDWYHSHMAPEPAARYILEKISSVDHI